MGIPDPDESCGYGGEAIQFKKTLIPDLISIRIK